MRPVKQAGGQASNLSSSAADEQGGAGRSGHGAGQPSAAPVIAPLLPAGIPVAQLSPIVLAYIGDAVFEVYVRQRLIAGSYRKPQALHRAATQCVSAASQAKLLQRLTPHLTAEEADVVRRGRNAKSGQPPRNADLADYRQATALECLIGYLYYEGRRDRLEQLMDWAFRERPEQDGQGHHAPEGR